jgi:hypothetical protein
MAGYPFSFAWIVEMLISQEIRTKLALMIERLISRCIDEARFIPYMATQDEVIKILLEDPNQFGMMMHEQMAPDQNNSPRGEIAFNFDAITKLGNFETLESFVSPPWNGSEADIAPLLKKINQLARTFGVYTGNASMIFDRVFEKFLDKFRNSLQASGMTIQEIDFTSEDVDNFKRYGEDYLSESKFLQAFTFERLLNSQVMLKKIIHPPPIGFSICKDLIRYALKRPDLQTPFVKFILRASYVSQGSWGDLFLVLLRLVCQETNLCDSAQLISLIDQDITFTCNLLQKSHNELSQWPAAKRRSAIEICLRIASNPKTSNTCAMQLFGSV